MQRYQINSEEVTFYLHWLLNDLKIVFEKNSGIAMEKFLLHKKICT